jgi:hypothetical protein
MTTKTSKQGRSYDIDGRAVIWHPEHDEDEPMLPDVRLPLRLKLGKLLALGEAGVLSSNEQMHKLIATVAPHAEDTVLEMDVNDFGDMVLTWQAEYALVTGALMGESKASAGSSASTEAPSSTTSAPASV